SEEHTSELQSRPHLVCRLLLEKKTITFRQRAAGGLQPFLSNCFLRSHPAPVRNFMFGKIWLVVFFFFNDTATPEIYPLSLPDPLPILGIAPPPPPAPRTRARPVRPRTRPSAA